MPDFRRFRRVKLWTAFLGALALAVAVGGAAFVGWNEVERRFHGPGPAESAAYFRIERGDSVGKVANALAEQGLISVPLIFRYGARLTGQDAKLKYGSYEIPARASMAEILELVTNPSAGRDRYVVTFRISAERGITLLHERLPGTGRSAERLRFTTEDPIPDDYAELVASGEFISYQVAVPEGLTSWQVTEALNSAEFLEGTVDDVPGEGLLAPDTYSVQRGIGVNEMVSRMLNSQQEILAQEWADRSPDLPISAPEEALTLASIVEKETGVAGERGVVASVFVNRLRKPMRLQTDPSVIYGITGGQRPLGRGLRQSELKRETPYNTYIIDGLPPTPICNPGREAIRAALNPAETGYLFFVADGSGGHAFAETYAEHRQNVRKWRQVERERQSGE